MAWELSVDLDRNGDEPVYLCIARAVALDVGRGRLKPGARLPGTRQLAASLGVHRNTVVAAYDELIAEGWLVAQPARGCFIALGSELERPRRFAPQAGLRESVPERAGFDLPRAGFQLEEPRAPLRYDLSGGTPDVGRVPHGLLARAYRRVLGRDARRLLDYGDPRGHRGLREGLAEMLARRRGLAARAEDVVVTRGSQMALWLSAHALLGAGDVVAVERFGYRPAWQALGATGARLVPLAVDEHGMNVGDLEKLARRERVRAVYLTPHHQYPTTAVLSPGRRLKLLELARRERIAVIEDDYDNEMHYEGRPVLPLASADRAGVVIYLGTLSKILAPGLRIGFVVAPRGLAERMAAQRSVIDRQGDLATEAAVAELLSEGEITRHAWRGRRENRVRRDALVDALGRRLGSVLELRVPHGGLALWARVEERVDLERWVEAAAARGVAVSPGRRFAFDGRAHPYLRIGFGRCDARELATAVDLLAKALPRRG